MLIEAVKLSEERRAQLERAHHELAEARDAALEATRLKSEFLANMSHELRTPLNAIIGYSEILAEDAEDSGRKDELADLEKIRSAGKHLLALINDVLDLSKIEAGKMEVHLETFEVSPMLQEDVPSQPRRWARLNGSLRRSDTLVSAALWLADSMARPAPDLMARRNGTPERRMDGTATHRSLWNPSYIVPRS
jgi:signal transduction histidine kinase